MPRTKPFQVSALSPTLTALLVASVNTFFANYLHPGWARIAPTFIDNWIYWGTGEAFLYAREHFSDTYYFRRWTITGPYVVMNTMGINGEASHASLAAISFTAISAVIFLFLFEITGSRLKATLGLVISTINPATILMIGNGYHPGALVFFLVLSLFLIAKTIRRNKRALWIAAGFCWGLAVVSYQIAMFFLPLVLSPLIHQWMSGPRDSSSLQPLLRNMRVFAAGFVLLLAFDFLIGIASGSYWPDLLSYSFRTGVGLSSSGDWGIEPGDFAQALLYSGYSILPTLIGCAIVIWGYSGFWRLQVKSVFLPGFLMTILVYFAVSFVGGNPLFVPHTVTPLVLISSVVLCGFFLSYSPHTTKLSATVTVAVFVALGVLNTYWTALIGKTDASWIALSFLAVIAIWSRTMLKVEKSHNKLSGKPHILSTVALTTLTFMMVVQSSSVGAEQVYENPLSFANYSSFIENLEQEISEVNEIAAAVDGRVWILDNRSWPGWSPLISSFYGLYSALSVESFPTRLDCGHVSWALTTQNPTIIVVGDQAIRTNENSLSDLLGECGNIQLQEQPSSSSTVMAVYSMVVE